MSARHTIRRRLSVGPPAPVLWGGLPPSATTASAPPPAPPRTQGAYRIVDSIAAPDALWDLASINPQRHRLYVGRLGGVLAVDLQTRAVLPAFVPSPFVHGALPLGNSGRALSN